MWHRTSNAFGLRLLCVCRRQTPYCFTGAIIATIRAQFIQFVTIPQPNFFYNIHILPPIAHNSSYDVLNLLNGNSHTAPEPRTFGHFLNANPNKLFLTQAPDKIAGCDPEPPSHTEHTLEPRHLPTMHNCHMWGNEGKFYPS